MFPKLLTTITFLSLFCGVSSGARQAETIVRIAVLQNVKSFNLSCDEKYYVLGAGSEERSYMEKVNSYLVRASSSGVIIGGKIFDAPVKVGTDATKSYLKINGKRYRDGVNILRKGTKLTVLNELGLESYLRGTVPKEVNTDWGPECLKAQAVASRTYALKTAGKHSADGFDLCSETHCQVYGGVDSEDPRTNAAIEATRSLVITYKGELAKTFYHAACGGHTENPVNIWDFGEDVPPYLNGRPDKFCAGNPHSYWRVELPEEKIRKSLNDAGFETGKIKDIRIAERTVSGRTKKLKIINYKEDFLITSNKFRMAVDAWAIQSAFFKRVSRKGDKFVFEGKGWGHGVGMCQWGAKGMADKGYDFRKILKFYYPGVEITRLGGEK
jgi:stage II sporulation protein D